MARMKTRNVSHGIGKTNLSVLWLRTGPSFSITASTICKDEVGAAGLKVSRDRWMQLLLFFGEAEDRVAQPRSVIGKTAKRDR